MDILAKVASSVLSQGNFEALVLNLLLNHENKKKYN